jgi:hypothetical protein
MFDNALLAEVMTADDAVGEDASPASAQQLTAAFAPAQARWGIEATERSASSAVRHHASGADLILMAQETTSLFAIMRGEPCRCGMYAAPH